MAGSWLDGNGNGGALDVVELLGADAATVKALSEIVQLGALLSMGTTSDGGALAVTVTVDGKWRRDYFRNADELNVWLAEAIPGVAEAMSTPRPSAAPRSRSRRS